jgi:alpha-tubulin suppressor-like RCC1 family protein
MFKNSALLVLSLFATIPFSTFGQNWHMVASGIDFSIAIGNDGSMWGWGNSSKLAGYGESDPQRTPIQMGSESWRWVETGTEHIIAIRKDGSLWAWGHNLAGQLGLGYTSFKEESMQQVGTDYDWLKVSSAVHNLALKQDSSLWTWGNNNYSYVLDTIAHDIVQPVQIHKDKKWIDVAAGIRHSLALDEHGNIWAWGHNTSGYLGNGSFQDTIISEPQKINGLVEMAQIEVGSYHSLALKQDGSIYSWGINWYGQLGQGFNDYTDRAEPTRIGSKNDWTRVRAGGYSSFAINEDKELYAWGYNEKGNLGVSSIISTGRPGMITYMGHWIDVAPAVAFTIDQSVYGEHTIGIREFSTNLCSTGNNATGQLGNDEEYSRLRFECDVQVQPSTTSSSTNPKELSVYPNPGNGLYQIDWSRLHSAEISIEIYDLSGKLRTKQKLKSPDVLDITHLKDGMYIANLQEENRIVKQKVIKVNE